MKRNRFAQLLLVLGILLVPFPIFAEEAGVTLASFAEQSIRVTLKKLGSESYELSLDPAGTEKKISGTPQVFSLTDPTRIVVDIPGLSGSGGKTVPLNEHLIKAIRIGRTSARIRVVLDLNSTAVPSYTTAISPFRVRFGSGISTSAATVSSVTEPAASSSSESSESELPSPELIGATKMASSSVSQKAAASSSSKRPPASSSVLPLASSSSSIASISSASVAAEESSSSFSSTPDVVSSEAATSSAVTTQVVPTPNRERTLGELQGAVVRQLQFQKGDGNSPGSVVVDLSTLVHYSLSRVQDNLFELNLEGAQLQGAFLELPQFPPDFIDGIQVVSAKTRGRNVVVQIYVEDGVKLKPFTSQGSLWLQVSY